MRLPSFNDPLLLGDGEQIKPTSAQTFARVEIPSNTSAQRLVSNVNRKLVDLPGLPEQLNTYSVILIYTISGLSDSEISIATGIKPQQVKRIREQSAYQQLESFVIDAVREQTKNDVVGLLAQKEVRAAERVSELVDSIDEKVALSAAKDILDRRGHVPKQQIDVSMGAVFKIEYVDKRKIIDVENEHGSST